jgi:molybdopterin-containing oxidoreductase family iron-sulfur binding subunit
MKSTRRKFIKIAGMSALGWSLCPALFNGSSRAAGHNEGHSEEHSGSRANAHGHGVRWAMAIDTARMTDEIMQKCIEACHSAHNVPHINNKQEIKWIWPETFHHLFPGQMNDHFHINEFPERKALALCNHCDNPPCVRVCPTKATFKRPDGIVMMDFHRCVGCRYCMAACPYGSRSFNFADPRKYLKESERTLEFPTRTKGVVEKCLFCYERLAEGKQPYCVEVSEGTIYFGDLNDPHSDVRKVLKERYAIRRKPELGTSPCVYYLI